VWEGLDFGRALGLRLGAGFSEQGVSGVGFWRGRAADGKLRRGPREMGGARRSRGPPRRPAGRSTQAGRSAGAARACIMLVECVLALGGVMVAAVTGRLWTYFTVIFSPYLGESGEGGRRTTARVTHRAVEIERARGATCGGRATAPRPHRPPPPLAAAAATRPARGALRKRESEGGGQGRGRKGSGAGGGPPAGAAHLTSLLLTDATAGRSAKA
jgi:hypothetical protein